MCVYIQGEIAHGQTKLTVSLEQQQQQQQQLHRLLLLLQEHAVGVGDPKGLKDKSLFQEKEEEDTLRTPRELAYHGDGIGDASPLLAGRGGGGGGGGGGRFRRSSSSVGEGGTEAKDAVRERDEMQLELVRAQDATARLQDDLQRVEREREEAVSEARSRCARLEGLLTSLQRQVVREENKKIIYM